MEKNLSEKLGEKIRILRESQGYSQEYIAKLLKISSSAYARMERGETTMDIARLQDIAKIFHFTPAQLMSIVENNSNVFHLTNNNNSFGSIQSTFNLSNNETLQISFNNLQALVDTMLKRIEYLESKTN